MKYEDVYISINLQLSDFFPLSAGSFLKQILVENVQSFGFDTRASEVCIITEICKPV